MLSLKCYISRIPEKYKWLKYLLYSKMSYVTVMLSIVLIDDYYYCCHVSILMLHLVEAELILTTFNTTGLLSL